MKAFILAFVLSLLAAPAFACSCTEVPTGPDSPNHQSSLSSTSEGGQTLVCDE